MSTSFKIKIGGKSSIPPDSRPAKRRAQRIAYTDDEDDAADAASAAPVHKKARTVSRAASADPEEGSLVDEDVDVDIDGDDHGNTNADDTRFLPDPQASTSRPLSPVQQSVKLRLPGNISAMASTLPDSTKNRGKDKRIVKPTKKVKRSVVFSDSEDERFAPPRRAKSKSKGMDEGFELDAEVVASKKTSRASSVTKTAKASGSGKEKEKEKEKEPPVPPVVDPARREDSGPRSMPDPLSEPIPKKRKLPPIKKNKQPGSGSAGPSTPASHRTVPPAPTPVEKREGLAPTTNQVGQRKPAGASTDLNLLDSSVYSELFRSAQPGASASSSGTDRKQKEEARRKELNKMRDEARAKREADARKHTFDLQAAPDKVQQYEEIIKARQSPAAFPNILGASLKELFLRTHAQSNRSPLRHQ
ncbi:uncharacterized protein BXZ73DRAFT_95431 [Epithele typhae]|uniref:uncharacterized protein n=1 Tax=Epithele typhae TaxID=378194 RepID=UPI002007F40B|nr:uncharacterized protein BXZ73DRAFT_95431 [Epithele typhae]KAH9945911.1 hypothetical protein BXZ73DRAFT_95431 [Epithele typhae]